MRKDILTLFAVLIMIIPRLLHAGFGTIMEDGLLVPSFLGYQCFEGTGYDRDEVWTEVLGSGGTINEDYTDTVLQGSQSLYLERSSASNYIHRTITASGTVYVKLLWRPVSLSTSGSHINIVGLFNSDLTTTGALFGVVYNTETSTFRWLASDGTSSFISSDDLNIATGHYFTIWIKYVKGTGVDGVLTMWYARDSTKFPGDSVYVASTISGGNTIDIEKIWISSGGSSSCIIDMIGIASTFEGLPW